MVKETKHKYSYGGSVVQTMISFKMILWCAPVLQHLIGIFILNKMAAFEGYKACWS